MKKYILSTLTISTFIVYAFYQQLVSTENKTVFRNTANNQKNSNSLITTDIPSNNTDSTNTTVVTTKVPVSTKPKTPVTTAPKGQYKDGSYTGISADAYYGNIQVLAFISGGELTDVQFLDHPQDNGTSVRKNEHAMPILRSEAIQAQSANVNAVSGATDSSGAFVQSLSSALAQAKN